MDYADMEWFQDRPPRQSQVPMPPQAQHPHQQHQQHQQQQQMDYTPSQHVIEQNDGFQYALFVAPNVLLQRYKQFGQVRASPSCLEPSDLIIPTARRPRLVRRIWRTHRSPQRAWVRRKHVCCNEDSGAPDVRADPINETRRRQDAAHSHVPLHSSRTIAQVPRCRTYLE